MSLYSVCCCCHLQKFVFIYPFLFDCETVTQVSVAILWKTELVQRNVRSKCEVSARVTRLEKSEKVRMYNADNEIYFM